MWKRSVLWKQTSLKSQLCHVQVRPRASCLPPQPQSDQHRGHNKYPASFRGFWTIFCCPGFKPQCWQQQRSDLGKGNDTPRASAFSLVHGSRYRTLTPMPWVPQAPYPFLRSGRPSSLWAPIAPCVPFCLSHRTLLLHWQLSGLSADCRICSMKGLIGINQSTQVKKKKKSKHWVRGWETKENTCWTAASSLRSSSKHNSCNSAKSGDRGRLQPSAATYTSVVSPRKVA